MIYKYLKLWLGILCFSTLIKFSNTLGVGDSDSGWLCLVMNRSGSSGCDIYHKDHYYLLRDPTSAALRFDKKWYFRWIQLTVTYPNYYTSIMNFTSTPLYDNSSLGRAIQESELTIYPNDDIAYLKNPIRYLPEDYGRRVTEFHRFGSFECTKSSNGCYDNIFSSEKPTTTSVATTIISISSSTSSEATTQTNLKQGNRSEVEVTKTVEVPQETNTSMVNMSEARKHTNDRSSFDESPTNSIHEVDKIRFEVLNQPYKIGVTNCPLTKTESTFFDSIVASLGYFDLDDNLFIGNHFTRCYDKIKFVCDGESTISGIVIAMEKEMKENDYYLANDFEGIFPQKFQNCSVVDINSTNIQKYMVQKLQFLQTTSIIVPSNAGNKQSLSKSSFIVALSHSFFSFLFFFFFLRIFN